MSPRPKMPTPNGELTPQELLDRIRDWAADQGYTCRVSDHAAEFAKVEVHEPRGAWTWTTIPNAHGGRRLKKHQIRYVIHQLNNRWRT